MAEEIKDSSTAMDEYLEGTLFKVIRENEKFLDNNVEEAYSEVVGLVSDAAIPVLALSSRDIAL